MAFLAEEYMCAPSTRHFYPINPLMDQMDLGFLMVRIGRRELLHVLRICLDISVAPG